MSSLNSGPDKSLGSEVIEKSRVFDQFSSVPIEDQVHVSSDGAPQALVVTSSPCAFRCGFGLCDSVVAIIGFAFFS